MPVSSPVRLTIGGRRVAVITVTIRAAADPRLRFDRVATALMQRLQASLSPAVPRGRTVVVTVTAPIRQDSRTAAALEARIAALLATGRERLRARICGNLVQVRVLSGGAAGSPRLIGFVHNPKPDASILFDACRGVLQAIGAAQRRAKRERWLIIVSEGGAAPGATVRQVCMALGASTVFERVLLAPLKRLS